MPTLANGAQVVLQFLQEGQTLQNVLNFIRFGGFTATEVQTLADDIINWWSTNVRAQTADNISLVQVKAQSLVNETDPTFEIATGLPLAGNGGDGLPNNCTVTLSLKTGLAGRSERGRIYHCGLRRGVLDAADPNRIAAGDLNNLLVAYRELLDPTTYTDSGVTLGVWSRLNNSGLAVTSINSDGVLDSQRRRLPGRGS